MHTDDALDRLHDRAVAQWCASGGDPTQLELASERREIALGRPVGSSA